MSKIYQKVKNINQCTAWVRNSQGGSWKCKYPRTLKVKPFKQALKRGETVLAEIEWTKEGPHVNCFMFDEKDEPVGNLSLKEQKEEYEALSGDY